MVGEFKENSMNNEIVGPLPVKEIVVHFATSHPEAANASKNSLFVPISKSLYEEISEPWKNAIIFKSIGRSFAKEFLKEQVQKLWKVKIHHEITAMGKGFYAMKCASTVERANILADGPWFIQGTHVWVQGWEPGFKPSQAKCKAGVVWISLPELPLEFYQKEILSNIGNAMGETIRIDARSLESENKRYAKLCVLVKEGVSAPKGVWLGSYYQDIEIMEGAWYCLKCKSFGHAGTMCVESKAACNVHGESKEEDLHEEGAAWRGVSKPPNVCVRVRSISRSPPSTTKRHTSPGSGHNSFAMALKERGRSRCRRKASSSQSRAVVGPQNTTPPLETAAATSKQYRESEDDQQLKCPHSCKSPTNAETSNNIGKLGRGQRTKWAKGSRSYSQSKEKLLDLPHNSRSSDPVGSRRNRGGALPEEHPLPSL
ncbi:uncharacterized protein LOC125491780 [Beta vulgaris subsp. vulgaris]|uniref:uncharacterized protein LOC125491780 n=1 Tax=Beta vulgaris subsp. vulgaris TaxID=3555 RepID=UPI002036A2EB|nr:uncharacterized protein LOC125491780 [Beta vulgaris subsp. vulgaris]